MATRQRAALRPPVMTPPGSGPGGQARGAGSSHQAPSRAGKRGVTFYLPEDKWKQLRRLSVDADATLQDLMEEAVGLLLSSRADNGSKAARPRKAAR
jgi:hypothetical protein